MIVKEYRILVPFEVDDFQRGHLYNTAEASKAETGGGEGVEVLVQREFGADEEVCPGRELEGIYTHKIYRVKSKVPWLVQKMLPEAAFELHEESWNAYPYFKTVITNPGYMKKSFRLEIESIHLQDAGDSDNALNTKHQDREVVEINIYDDQYVKQSELNAKNDPRRVRSEKMEIGPLEEDWTESDEIPVMCAYKLVNVTFSWRGVGGRIERMLHKHYPSIFSKFHREVYCKADEWWDKSLESIREHEEKTKQELKAMLKTYPHEYVSPRPPPPVSPRRSRAMADRIESELVKRRNSIKERMPRPTPPTRIPVDHESVDDGYHCLVNTCSMIELKTLMNWSEGRPQRPTAELKLVRRKQRELRESIKIHGSYRGRCFYRERPRFQFLSLKVGSYLLPARPDYPLHAQQGQRPNGITVNPGKARLEYEFSLKIPRGETCYVVWALWFHEIVAMTDHRNLFYIWSRKPHTQLCAFVGRQPSPKHDFTSTTGDKELHCLAFASEEQGAAFRDTLLRYDPVHFTNRFKQFEDFFKEYYLHKDHEKANQDMAIAMAANTLPHIPHYGFVALPGPTVGYAIPTPEHPTQLQQEPIASFYAQSQYNMQPAGPSTGFYTPTSANATFSIPNLFSGPGNQTGLTPLQPLEDRFVMDTPNSRLEFRESDYLPGAMISQDSMGRDSEYLFGGITTSAYARPYPGGQDTEVNAFRPSNRHFSDLDSLPLADIRDDEP
ncbi:unnamed protein product, partial [Mesorhabditis spiculigera]